MKSKITFIELAEGTQHIEVWISTDWLDEGIGSAYLVDIDKDALMKKDKVVKQDDPFIYADLDAYIPDEELELIEDVLSQIDRDLFILVKTLYPETTTLMGVPVGFRFTEEYVDSMNNGGV